MTDLELIRSFLKDTSFITVLNDEAYQLEEYGLEDVIEKKSVVTREQISLENPVTSSFKIRINEVQTQDDRFQIMPLGDYETSEIKQTYAGSVREDL